MELLDFARGPALQAAALIFVAGLTWRLLHLFLQQKKTDLSEARQGGEIGGGIRSIFSRFRHHEAFRQRTRNGTILAYTVHIGLAIVIFGGAPHIIFIGSFTGLGWTPLPSVVIHIAAALTLAALLTAMGRRLTHPVLKLISNFDDYFTWLVTTLPVLTGLLAVAHVGARYETLLAIHILSFNVFLIWFPFGKLMHSFISIGSRYTTGVTFTRRGAKV
ncbi:MAG: nitrate reductase [Gammaproteobacteria bacterium]|nr:nitrate reductase [Gammaproteobacteria bacterium]MDH3429343.1 nitrate reductase [Gammaproteobacteria bacterium]MDH3433862.1 nitrate reductase [Gammaproteobacteria bacterium]